jgi:hydrogenase maturation protein HypF
VARFSELFIFKPEMVACDLHPDYLSTFFAVKLAGELKIPLVRVQHHHAHIASCMAENHIDEKVIGISMDGTGYGSDGNIWGGEFLVADLKSFTRYTHFDYIPMPGGDKVVDEPWRMAFSYLYHYFGNSFDFRSVPGFKSIDNNHISIVKEMIDKKINSPVTSGAGRLFDAVSAILGLSSFSRFDSEGPMLLESVAASGIDDHYLFETGAKVVFAKTLLALVKDLNHSEIPVVSARFHNTIAMAIACVSEDIRRNTFIDKVVLSGGVFQNKYLLERLTLLLGERHFEVFTNNLVPSNDGGISLGQLIIASKTRGSCV